MDIKYIVAIMLSVPLIALYFLSMAIPIKFESSFIDNPRTVAVATFYTTLVLLIVREFVDNTKIRDMLSILVISIASLYSYIAGLYFELNYLATQKHVVIPPSFVYIPCSDPSRCNSYAALSISIPLTIEFILLIYGIVGLSKSLSSHHADALQEPTTT